MQQEDTQTLIEVPNIKWIQIQRAMLQVACKDDDVNDIIQAVRSVANTGSIGDGKIFVNELLDVIRIRTGETGEDAITENINGRDGIFIKYILFSTFWELLLCGWLLVSQCWKLV